MLQLTSEDKAILANNVRGMARVRQNIRYADAIQPNANATKGMKALRFRSRRAGVAVPTPKHL